MLVRRFAKRALFDARLQVLEKLFRLLQRLLLAGRAVGLVLAPGLEGVLHDDVVLVQRHEEVGHEALGQAEVHAVGLQRVQQRHGRVNVLVRVRRQRRAVGVELEERRVGFELVLGRGVLKSDRGGGGGE